MQAGSRRKYMMFALGALVIVLAGVGIFVVMQLQKRADLSVSGFGDEVIRTNFTAVGNALRDADCARFLSNDGLNLIASTDAAALAKKTITFTRTNYPAESTKAVNCRYVIGDKGQVINLRMYAYKPDSKIDDSQTALFARVNGDYIKGSGIDSNKVGAFNYFYGESKVETGLCYSTFFDDQNDFEYGVLTYIGFDCATSKALNVAIMELVAGEVDVIMQPFRISTEQ